jgi:putative transposase
MRPAGTPTELEVRRRIAANLLLDGMGIREVARAIEASPSSVKRWKDALESNGEPGLSAKEQPGREPLLTDQQKRRLLRLLERGPIAAGYKTEQWTCPRVADLIEEHFGVRYHAGHVWRILRSLGWSWQQPEQLARERDEQEIQRWRIGEWPRI